MLLWDTKLLSIKIFILPGKKGYSELFVKLDFKYAFCENLGTIA